MKICLQTDPRETNPDPITLDMLVRLSSPCKTHSLEISIFYGLRTEASAS